MRKLFSILAVAGLMSGCAQTIPEQVTVAIKGDTYCDLARKIAWSQNDTVDTVKQIVRENAKIDRVCGMKTAS